MADFTYPTQVELIEIEQEVRPRLMSERIVFDIFPIRNREGHNIQWEQRDRYFGLQQLRGLGGEPSRVKKVGLKAFEMKPGVYGEFIDFTETEMTARRPIGQRTGTVSIDDLVVPAQEQLLIREFDRIETIIWTLLTTGTFSVALPYGTQIIHTDTYDNQTFTAGVTWATTATATPLANFRSVQQLGSGVGANFGAGARAYMNRVTANNMLANTNANDLGGKRTSGLANVNSMGEANELLARDDLPTIVVYDGGFFNDSDAFVKFIPNNRVVVIGQRPGNQSVGEYQIVSNANNEGMAAGPYTKVKDDPNDVPRKIEVHRGHNGGPAMFFPSQVVVMTV